jgi:hypothetical protein
VCPIYPIVKVRRVESGGCGLCGRKDVCDSQRHMAQNEAEQERPERISLLHTSGTITDDIPFVEEMRRRIIASSNPGTQRMKLLQG